MAISSNNFAGDKKQCWCAKKNIWDNVSWLIVAQARWAKNPNKQHNGKSQNIFTTSFSLTVTL